jgi:cytochrome c2
MRTLAAACVLAAAPAAAGCAGGSEPYRQVAGGDPGRGARAIEARGCGSCHSIPGIHDARGTVGPPLDAFGRRGFIAGELANTPANLVRWIENPQAVEPGTAMPDLGIPPAEARSIAAYLYTLR